MEIIEEVKKSNSNNIVKKISETMDGKTFHHHYHILYDIRTLMGKEKKVYTEIGTYCGGSTSLLLHHEYPTEINCIDPLHVLKNQRNTLENNIKKFNKNNYDVHIYQKYSNDKDFINYLKGINFKTDILFIDGDHRYDGVVNDYVNFSEFVNPDGYIIFDDYLDYKHSPDVKKAVDNIVKSIDKTKYEVIGTIPNFHKSYDGGYNLEYLNEFIIQKKSKENNDIHFVIIMATYYRKDGTTRKYLETSLESILNQNYKKWDLIIVGDKYEKESELLEIIEMYKKRTENRIIYIRNENVEREKILPKWRHRLWQCAGATSMNEGLKYARLNNYKYYAHLDDDDFWEKNHLESLVEVYKKYPNCIFANTQSKFVKDKVLPDNNIKEIYENNMLPSAGNMIHSSFSFRIDIVPFLYETDLEKGIERASDARMLININEYIKKNKQYCSIYVPKLTCSHIEENVKH